MIHWIDHVRNVTVQRPKEFLIYAEWRFVVRCINTICTRISYIRVSGVQINSNLRRTTMLCAWLSGVLVGSFANQQGSEEKYIILLREAWALFVQKFFLQLNYPVFVNPVSWFYTSRPLILIFFILINFSFILILLIFNSIFVSFLFISFCFIFHWNLNSYYIQYIVCFFHFHSFFINFIFSYIFIHKFKKISTW